MMMSTTKLQLDVQNKTMILSIKPRIEILTEKQFVGCRMTMSLTKNRTGELWRNFMPKRKEIQYTVGIELYSVNIYSLDYFNNFNPQAKFEKWALCEVSKIDSIPEGMESLTIPGGMYAVFIHKGPASKGPETFGFIFGSWLPGSGYELDNRPHFEILGEKYKNDDAVSEEEIWIPVRLKTDKSIYIYKN
jgi:AraC family transcriptional regulator